MMSVQVLVIVMVIVGTASGLWFAKRQQPSREQTIAAVAAIVASIYIMAVPRFHDTAWFSMAAIIGVIAGTFLLDAWLHPRRRPPQVG